MTASPDQSLRRLLREARAAALSEREMGTFFERVARACLLRDPMQARLYEAVQPWAEWATGQGLDARDHGIDLVARLAGGEGYAAIQCKYRDPDHTIGKADLDSFLAASAKAPFTRRIVIDSTTGDWSEPARATSRAQMIPVLRIGLRDLEASPLIWPSLRGTGDDIRVETRGGKKLRPHQAEALTAVRAGLAKADRGKLVMACGTGKTFTALKIAEVIAGRRGRVLFLVPSLALMAQTVREWTADSTLPLTAFAVCSDTQVGKRRTGPEDLAEIDVLDLAFPATTNAEELALRATESPADGLCVVFGTYQSLEVIEASQGRYGLPAFDLVICDEAHRTTGARFEGEEASGFVKVHDAARIRGTKRLYMTATPRIYGDRAKSRAQEVSAELASMDDPGIYGRTLHYLGFAQAVEQGLLSDYRVIVLAVDEGLVSTQVQALLGDAGNELALDDATRIVGCYKALSRDWLAPVAGAGADPMRRAIAFCNRIDASKLIETHFAPVVDSFAGHDDEGARFRVAVRHVDGTMGASARGARLDWLDAPPENTCHILSNARCLAEGVDVPALDAILFLHPRNSQIDVVQSVGRVMRKAPGKRLGHVILPIGIPPGVAPEAALRDNRRYRVVWQVLNALRSHDERLDATINQAGLGQDVSDRIGIVGVTAPDPVHVPADAALPETATIGTLPSSGPPPGPGIGTGPAGAPDPDRGGAGQQLELAFTTDLARAVRAKLVEKCGSRDYWEDWAANVGEIARTHITRLAGLVQAEGSPGRAAFGKFLGDLHKTVNSAITEGEAIEMLAQHLVTRPVFGTLFGGGRFVAENPVSKALDGVLEAVEAQGLEKEREDLEGFYASVQRRAAGITDPQARQALILELYDTFFRRAFPKTTARLGIVYTPVEVVDFILRSAGDILAREFGCHMADRGVHIIDPFTGTGTFITRLLQSGLIPKDALARKLREDIHANEIVLLAYYIAAINVEATAQALRGEDAPRTPFAGMCLTDTFAAHERGDLVTLMPDNSERITRQKGQEITVIVGNPPYSAGQKSQDDDAANITYPDLDARIRQTYAAGSRATNRNALYDSYIRAIRWASDRIGDRGVIGFVTGSAWIERGFADGLRKCLADEFTSLYVVHLRGDIRKNMLSRSKAGEGENIFGQGSMTGAAISLLVKNPGVAERGQIFYHDIGDYLKRADKLARLVRFGSIAGIAAAGGWTRITPDGHGDWLDQRDPGFGDHLRLGSKKPVQEPVLFDVYSRGVATTRDAWCYNPSKKRLAENIARTIAFYNDEVARRRAAEAGVAADPAIARDPKRISWSRALEADLRRGKWLDPDDGVAMPSLYRPFTKQWLHYSRRLNEMVYRMPAIFPEPGLENRVIAVTGIGARAGFSCLMADTLPDIQLIENGQCFPLWRYAALDGDAGVADQRDLLGAAEPGEIVTAPSGQRYARHSAITARPMALVRRAYPDAQVTEADVFDYLYGVLHSEDYRTRFAANLAKELPRLPLMPTWEGFKTFLEAGRALGDLHTGFETLEPWPVTVAQGNLALAVIDDPVAFYRVEKMRFGGSARSPDRSRVHLNASITLEDIPPDAWDYEVNGKPALTWVMERQQVRTDKASSIVSDPNAWAVETMNNPAWPFELFCRVITLSMETRKIVRDLPGLDLPPAP